MPKTYDELQREIDEIHTKVKEFHLLAQKMESIKLAEDKELKGYLAELLNTTDNISNLIEEMYMDKKVDPKDLFPADG